MKDIKMIFKDSNSGYLNFYRQYLFDLRNNLYKWEGLPESISGNNLEHILTISGYGVATQYKGDVLFLQGAISGIDYQNYPIDFVSANHAIPTLTRKINKNCVVAWNVPDYQYPHGDVELIDIFAHRLMNIAVSIDCSLVNSRVSAVFDVENSEQAKQVAISYKQLMAGNPFVINLGMKNLISEKNNIYPVKARDNLVTDLLQDSYNNTMSEFFKIFGIKSLNVDKSQYVNGIDSTSSSEAESANKNVRLDARKKFCEKCNKMFGTNITVDLNREIIKQVMEGGIENGTFNVQTD